MTHEEMKTLLSKPNDAIVGVNRARGGPQLTPVWFAWDGKAFYFTTTRDRAKFPNIKRDPHISIIVNDAAMHKYVVAYGRAKIVEQDFADLLRPIIKKHVPADQVEQRVAMITGDPQRVIIVLHPDKIVTN